MCRLARVSRGGYYRSLLEQHPEEEEVEVRAAIQEIALGHHRRYGYRRIGAELRRRGLEVNHKRVVRIMREDNLLAIRRRRFVLTSDSEHDLEGYLNLAKRMTLTAANQLWIADLTYIRLKREFVYLAVILDKWSRRVVGWELDRTLAARLAVAALEKAIAARLPRPGLVHHSDRGIQYASNGYVKLLEKHHMVPSMSRPANPYDNATCESFMKTLKTEEMDCREYQDLEDLRGHVEEFLDRYYNGQRLHSALGYRTPEEFEEQCGTPNSGAIADAPKMNFSGMGNLPIRWQLREPVGEQMLIPHCHRLDEFPTGYSLASCSPAALASASPDQNILIDWQSKMPDNFSERGFAFIARVSQ